MLKKSAACLVTLQMLQVQSFWSAPNLPLERNETFKTTNMVRSRMEGVFSLMLALDFGFNIFFFPHLMLIKLLQPD